MTPRFGDKNNNSFDDDDDDDDDVDDDDNYDKEKGETVVWFDLKLWLIKLARWHSNTRSLVRTTTTGNRDLGIPSKTSEPLKLTSDRMHRFADFRTILLNFVAMYIFALFNSSLENEGLGSKGRL